MYLLDRPTLTLDDLRGDYAWQRQDELFRPFDRENAAGDRIQRQLFAGK